MRRTSRSAPAVAAFLMPPTPRTGRSPTCGRCAGAPNQVIALAVDQLDGHYSAAIRLYDVYIGHIITWPTCSAPESWSSSPRAFADPEHALQPHTSGQRGRRPDRRRQPGRALDRAVPAAPRGQLPGGGAAREHRDPPARRPLSAPHGRDPARGRAGGGGAAPRRGAVPPRTAGSTTSSRWPGARSRATSRTSTRGSRSSARPCGCSSTRTRSSRSCATRAEELGAELRYRVECTSVDAGRRRA